MTYSSTEFPEEYDFLAVCHGAMERQDYKAALYSLKKGLSRNLEEGIHVNGAELMRYMRDVVAALESNLRKAYGYDWQEGVEIPKAREDWRRSRCCFCQRKEQEVAKIIVGGTGSICNQCVAICNEILKDAE